MRRFVRLLAVQFHARDHELCRRLVCEKRLERQKAEALDAAVVHGWRNVVDAGIVVAVILVWVIRDCVRQVGSEDREERCARLVCLTTILACAEPVLPLTDSNLAQYVDYRELVSVRCSEMGTDDIGEEQYILMGRDRPCSLCPFRFSSAATRRARDR